MTKKDTIAMYREKLATDARWAIRGMLRVYQEQTLEEQEYEATTEHNGVGFTGTDGEILASFSKQYQVKGYLSPKQMALVFKKMPKYAGQLYKLTNVATTPAATSPAELERRLHEIEAAGDREQTIRDERAKARARARMEAA